jgi:hypothetical protein
VSGSASLPPDENGDVLRRMLKSGDDLTEARMIDFEHVFSSSTSALSFLTSVLNTSDRFTVSWYDAESCWNVRVSRYMVPTHAAITALESSLHEVAGQYGGRADGWGCCQVGGGDS